MANPTPPPDNTKQVLWAIGIATFILLGMFGSCGKSTSKTKPAEGTAECMREQRRIAHNYDDDADSDDVVRALHEMSEACS